MKVKFSDVVRRANTKEDRFNTDKEFYVGGEHMITGEYLITRRGTIAGSNIGPMFYFGFRKGQVLLASRSPDLKKAGMVTFDGICSEKTFVIETKDESVLLQDFLPAIVRSESFWKYANDNQSGSVNHFINWTTFANYEFNLPDIETQRKLSALLWAMERTKTAYKNLIAKTDELVKSQFIEMFGRCPKGRLGDYITQIRGVSYKPADLSLALDDGHITLLRANNINGNHIVLDDVQYVSRAKVSEVQIIQNNDILMCASSGSLDHVGKTALCNLSGTYTFGAFCKLIRASGMLQAEYIASYMNSDEYRRTIMELAQGTNINNLRNEHIDELRLPIPTTEQQIVFVELLRQSDKSKFAAQQALADLTATQKALMRQYLG